MKFYFAFIFLSISLFLATLNTFADVSLPPLIGDNMVLQRNVELKIWGWASKDEQVTITFNGVTQNVSVGTDKKWQFTFPAMEAGGPYDMLIKGENEIFVKNILIGDVWVCGGQSNMDWKLIQCGNMYKSEYELAENYSQIRHIKIKETATSKTFDAVNASGWKMASEYAADFSAVGYFFAKELYNKYKIPIGLLSSNWGGSPAEVWMSAESLMEFPEIPEEYKRLELENAEKIKQQNIRERDLDKWIAEARDADEGFQENKPKWYEWHQNDKDWKNIQVPGDWNASGLGNTDGIIWFRKEIMLPASAVNQVLELDLGYIDDMDVSWFNGSVVGTQDKFDIPRIYKIPLGAAKAGKNIIAVRVIDHGGGGGINGNIRIKGKDFEIPVSGEWHYKVGYDFKRMPKYFPPDYSYNQGWKPSAVYNAMIYPLLNYKIKGVIWYQGESNAGRALQYRKLFPALIKDWRRAWNIGDFPFLYVQLANFKANPVNPDAPWQSQWAELREAQSMALALPNTAMATAIDIGEPGDIHPKNKMDVGKRLSLLAMKVVYEDQYVLPYSPQFESMASEGLRVRIHFKNTGTGLKVRGGQYVKNFVMAGTDKKFHPARAYLEDNTVVVECPKAVDMPIAVRYSWADNPEPCNLYNNEGLPTLPFRTDDWPGITR